MTDTGFKKYDTFSETIYFVRLAQDAKSFQRKDGEPDDVVLTFCDNNRIPNHEDLWVDARVVKFQSERASKFMKGDICQIKGKLRWKKQDDGSYRGKIYDAIVHSYTPTRDREATKDLVSETPAFE